MASRRARRSFGLRFRRRRAGRCPLRIDFVIIYPFGFGLHCPPRNNSLSVTYGNPGKRGGRCARSRPIRGQRPPKTRALRCAALRVRRCPLPVAPVSRSPRTAAHSARSALMGGTPHVYLEPHGELPRWGFTRWDSPRGGLPRWDSPRWDSTRGESPVVNHLWGFHLWVSSHMWPRTHMGQLPHGAIPPLGPSGPGLAGW